MAPVGPLRRRATANGNTACVYRVNKVAPHKHFSRAPATICRTCTYAAGPRSHHSLPPPAPYAIRHTQVPRTPARSSHPTAHPAHTETLRNTCTRGSTASSTASSTTSSTASSAQLDIELRGRAFAHRILQRVDLVVGERAVHRAVPAMVRRATVLSHSEPAALVIRWQREALAAPAYTCLHLLRPAAYGAALTLTLP